MREAVRLATRVAGTNANLLITGESGTGKDALARFVHLHSLRASKAFVRIDCAALPADLLEAELFGYERGAFTGARHKLNPGGLKQHIVERLCWMKSRINRSPRKRSFCA